MEHIPRYEFQKCVTRYGGDYQQKSFSCWDQFLAMGFAQFTYRESLRDIEACLSSVGGKLYHMGFRSKVARSTLADANELRDWRIFADFAQALIAIARPLYVIDRGYLDFERLYIFTLSAAFFVVRTKSNILLQRRYSHPVDKATGVRSDHTVILTAINSVKAYPEPLRRISYLDVSTRKRFK